MYCNLIFGEIMWILFRSAMLRMCMLGSIRTKWNDWRLLNSRLDFVELDVSRRGSLTRRTMEIARMIRILITQKRIQLRIRFVRLPRMKTTCWLRESPERLIDTRSHMFLSRISCTFRRDLRRWVWIAMPLVSPSSITMAILTSWR